MVPNSACAITRRYVTLKVRVTDEEAMLWTLFDLTDSQGLLTDSEEVFFHVPAGQLKLRLAHPGKDIGTLISSRQTNHHNKGNICEERSSEITFGANQLRHTIGLALEELAILRKKRRTFTLGPNVFLHLDSMEGLGSFLDIEIHPDSAESVANNDDKLLLCRADDLLRNLAISHSGLIPHSYLQLFLRAVNEESDESAFSDESVPSS